MTSTRTACTSLQSTMLACDQVGICCDGKTLPSIWQAWLFIIREETKDFVCMSVTCPEALHRPGTIIHAGATMDEAQITSIGQCADDLDIAVRLFLTSALHPRTIMHRNARE